MTGAPLPGLVHHWNFDEGPDWHDDAFGAVADATAAIDVVGGVDLVFDRLNAAAWVSGRQYTGLEFDGVNGNLAASADLGPVVGGNTSISFWIRTNQSHGDNAGAWTTTFIDHQEILPDGSSMGLAGQRTPRAVDWDGDGDFDLLVGHSSGIWRFENTGTAAAPAFAAGVRVQAAGSDIALSGSMQIAWADMDGDGISDLVVVDTSGTVRWYRNTAAANQTVSLAAAQTVDSSAGGNFVLPDWRFDAADWDGDGLTDLIMGTRQNEMRFYPNIGTAGSPQFDPNQFTVLQNGAYNLYPRLVDLNRNGLPDLVRGINWGSIDYWFDAAPNAALGTASGQLGVQDSAANGVNVRSFTDGAVVDFADLNGDGVLDLLTGGFAGSGGIQLAYGDAANATAVVPPGPDNPLTAPGLLGSEGIQWACLDKAGRIGIAVDGSPAVRAPQAINDGNWHHVVLTRNAGNGAVSIWLDGLQVASAVGPGGGRTAPITRIGRMQSDPGAAFFRGRIDQLHIFNRIIDPATVEMLRDNHAPKTWVVECDGETGAPFDTPSVLINTYVYDAERDALEVAAFDQPAHGSVSQNADGSFRYTPSAGFTGPDEFPVWIHDGRGGYRKNIVRVQVTSPPDPNAGLRTTTFVDHQAVQAGGTNLGFTGQRTPRAVDWDADGDLDLLVGHSSGIWRYENTGTPAAPAFASGVRVQAGGSDIDLSGSMNIAWADMNGDGVPDLVVVDNGRSVRWYRNTSTAGQAVALAPAQSVASAAGGNFVLPDARFDAVDWDGDGLTDLVMGNRGGEVRFYPNTGTANTPQFDPSQFTVLESGSYNLYPRLFDINRNGQLDVIRGVNWGNIDYWFDAAPGTALGGSDGQLTVQDASGSPVDVRGFTDGAVVDFADLNDDGVLDVLIGGFSGSGGIQLAFGNARSPVDSIAAIEAIYDAHPTGLGNALEANSQALLNQIRAEHSNILMHVAASSLSERQTIFTQLVAHVGKYAFLQMDDPLDTAEFHHLPSIAGQNLMTLHHMLPDTPGHRQAVADAVGLTGTHREVYLEMGLHVGDNQQASAGQIESVRDFMRWQPNESFPDAVLTLDHYYGDGRGGMVSGFRGTKNTFNFGEGNDVAEWAGDLQNAVESFFGAPVQRGDYFTLVMAHEVTHSLDGYVINRANKDLWRRKGQVLTLAAGPDVVSAAGDDRDWYDWPATRAKFQTEGYWDGNMANWDQAWSDYWSSGPGAAFKDLSFMRGGIDWFLNAPQEAMATQANHHWPHSEGRIIAAIDRWQRGVDSGNEPMKANLTEVLTFLDWISCGMNKLVMHDNRGVQTPYPRSEYNIYHAWLERDENGYITGVDIEDRSYRFEVDQTGIVTGIVEENDNPLPQGQSSAVEVIRDAPQLIRISTGGGQAALSNWTQPANGVVTDAGDGRLLYSPFSGFTGTDSFSYLRQGDSEETTVRLQVRPPKAGISGVLMETWTGIPGTSVADLTADPDFPYQPDASETRPEFAAPINRAENFGTRMTALLVPPSSGSYTFWIASDDNGELWLGEDRRRSTRRLIASVPGWTNDRQWDKFPEQQSQSVDLVAGRAYYIEALQKEAGGGDNLAVAWEGPGIAQQVIGLEHLRTIDNRAPSVRFATEFGFFVENGPSQSIDLFLFFEDRDLGDQISSVELISNSDPGLASVNLSEGILTVTPQPGKLGTGSATVRAADLGGATLSRSFDFTIIPDSDGDGIGDMIDPDDDNDGIPDSWEILYGLAQVVDDTAADIDGDGWSNWQEFLADTHPDDASTHPHLRVAWDGDNEVPVLEFDSSSAREYQIEYRDALDSGTWLPLGNRTPGTGGEMSQADETAPSQRFYRLRIGMPD